MKSISFLSATVAALSAPSYADEFTPALESFYQNHIAEMATNQAIIDAVNSQNTATAGYSLADIEALDKAWRAEVGTSNTPTISPVLDNTTSAMLREQVSEFGGQITEIFIMDAQGLNVAASSVTSDYWQGDEAKHSETYGVGPDALHISEIELDESTQRYQGQISFPVVDPSTGQPIGAITVGVDAQSLL